MLSLLIKPSSSLCNIACTYCFYLDESVNRATACHNVMSIDTAEALIARAFEYENRCVNFMFQGGEPLLAGFEFFEKFHELADKHNTQSIAVNFSLQTNAMFVDDRWAEFFGKHNYLLGVSLDGTKEIHDKYRIHKDGGGSFDKVVRGIACLEKYDVPFNILTVLTDESALRADEILEFFLSSGYRHLQFIPCLDPIGSPAGKFLSAENYGRFLDESFAVYKRKLLAGEYFSIRYFDNLVGRFLGRPFESCDMQGACSINTVIEADGSVYPCDFYALDEYNMGNINEQDFYSILKSGVGEKFCQSSKNIQSKCMVCRHLQLCRAGGCRRHRSEGSPRFCAAYMRFFDTRVEEIKELAHKIFTKQV